MATISIGTDINMNSNNGQSMITGTTALGYNINQYIAIEADFDHSPSQRGQGTQEDAHIGAVLGYPLGKWTPSITAGAGYGWYGNGNSQGNALPIYVVGTGVSYAWTDKISTSIAYSYMGYFNKGYLGQNGVQVGINYSF